MLNYLRWVSSHCCWAGSSTTAGAASGLAKAIKGSHKQPITNRRRNRFIYTLVLARAAMQHGRHGQILLGCRFHSGLGLTHVHTLSHDAGNVLPGLGPSTRRPGRRCRRAREGVGSGSPESRTVVRISRGGCCIPHAPDARSLRRCGGPRPFTFAAAGSRER